MDCDVGSGIALTVLTLRVRAMKKNLVTVDMSHKSASPPEIGRCLVAWWFKNGRSYPWRRERDVYKILVAEIMLQRTRADQVASVYAEFLQKFPSVFDLSRAEEKEIGSYFRKLGLHWKTSLVKKMAEFVVSDYDGVFPRERKELLRIPFIGEYISDAIMSFVFNERVIVIDSNVCRIVKRVYDLQVKGEMRRNRTVKEIVSKLLPSNENSRRLNFALIDFGALICKPIRPLCQQCTINDFCEYYSAVFLSAQRYS